MAFKSVMHLWNKKPLKIYGGRMSESILAILCHIIKGEKVIMVGMLNTKLSDIFKSILYLWL